MTGFELLQAMVTAVWPVVKALAELGLVVFAGTQLWLHHRERRDRQRTALAVVFAEFARLQTRSLDWEQEDLLAAARAGQLYYDGLAPSDWGVVVRSLGDLGPESAALGASAHSLLHMVIRSARTLADTNGSGTAGAPGPLLEAHCKEVLGEVVKTLNDAMNAAPRGLSETQFTLSSPTSKAGQLVAQLYNENLKKAQALVPSGFWATRAGRVLSAVGRAVRP